MLVEVHIAGGMVAHYAQEKPGKWLRTLCGRRIYNNPSAFGTRDLEVCSACDNAATNRALPKPKREQP